MSSSLVYNRYFGDVSLPLPQSPPPCNIFTYSRDETYHSTSGAEERPEKEKKKKKKELAFSTSGRKLCALFNNQSLCKLNKTEQKLSNTDKYVCATQNELIQITYIIINVNVLFFLLICVSILAKNF